MPDSEHYHTLGIFPSSLFPAPVPNKNVTLHMLWLCKISSDCALLIKTPTYKLWRCSSLKPQGTATYISDMNALRAWGWKKISHKQSWLKGRISDIVKFVFIPNQNSGGKKDFISAQSKGFFLTKLEHSNLIGTLILSTIFEKLKQKVVLKRIIKSAPFQKGQNGMFQAYCSTFPISRLKQNFIKSSMFLQNVCL